MILGEEQTQSCSRPSCPFTNVFLSSERPSLGTRSQRAAPVAFHHPLPFSFVLFFFTALCILKLLLIFCFLAMYDVVSLPQYNVNAMRERNLSFSFTPVSPVPRTVPGPRRCSVNKCCLNKCPGISKKISQAINTLSS